MKMAVFIFYDVISGYDVIIPVPDVAQIVVLNFLYPTISSFREIQVVTLVQSAARKVPPVKNKWPSIEKVKFYIFK